ncbi:hypothetical protein FHU41_001716 [Psychromicrobium silvestre]|uniref:Uncharacterized protein n=1 Tax=Psychromicrobium silvestre TaxID=1645614 RepID=A0A7Y9S7Z0_9MICC|nr:hypothetical protein [Psychromicrobium silvestre]
MSTLLTWAHLPGILALNIDGQCVAPPHTAAYTGHPPLPTAIKTSYESSLTSIGSNVRQANVS